MAVPSVASAGSTAFISASDGVVGHQAHLQQALTRDSESPKIVSWCCHDVPLLDYAIHTVASVPRRDTEIKYAERLTFRTRRYSEVQ